MRTVARWARRGVGWGTRRLWAETRPGRATDLRGRPLDPAPRDGTTPRPDQSFVPATAPTGPWSGVDPRVTDEWPSPLASLVGLAVWAVVGLRVRREVTELLAARDTGDTSGDEGSDRPSSQAPGRTRRRPGS